MSKKTTRPLIKAHSIYQGKLSMIDAFASVYMRIFEDARRKPKSSGDTFDLCEHDHLTEVKSHREDDDHETSG